MWSRYHERGRGAIYSMREAWIDYRDNQAGLYIHKLVGGGWDEPIRLDHGEARGYLALSIAIDEQDAAHVSWEGFGQCGGGDVGVGEVTK